MNFMRSSWKYAMIIALSTNNNKVDVRESKITDKLSRYAVTMAINAKQKVLIYIYKSIGTKKRASYYVTNELHHDVANTMYNQLKKGVLS